MRPIVKSELRKLRATPTMWWLLLAVVGIGVAATIGVIAFTGGDGDSLTSNKALREAMHAAGAGSVLVSVAGIIGMAGEFRFGQADQTFLSTPRRAGVLWAKTLVFGLLGLLFGLVAAAASVATLGAYLASEGERLPLAREAVWLTAAGDVGSAVLFAILGVAIGAISRNQVAAIVGTLAWLMLVEGTLFPITDLARWLPGSAARALRRDTAADLLSMRAGATVLTLWVLAALALGLTRTVRDDITERATR